MPFNSARVCPEDSKKASLFPAFGGPWTKLKKVPGLSSTGPAEENSRDTHIYKERFYTAP